VSTTVNIDAGPARVNFRRVVAGTDLVRNFLIERDGVAVDVSEDTFRAFVVTDTITVEAVAEYVALTGRVNVSWTEEDTALMGTGCHTWWFYWTADGITSAIMTGRFEVIAGGE